MRMKMKIIETHRSPNTSYWAFLCLISILFCCILARELGKQAEESYKDERAHDILWQTNNKLRYLFFETFQLFNIDKTKKHENDKIPY